MDRLGVFSLAVALTLALYGMVASVVGARRDRPLLVESARTSAYSLLALVAAANGTMLAAILSNDFRIQYVAQNSSRATPTFFKVLSLWSADAGSLLLWNLVLAGYIAAVAFRFRRGARRPETFPWAMAVMFGVSAFYLFLVLGPTRPFDVFDVAVLDGLGPLPLLQNHPLMAAHPPFLYLGFIGFTVPFGFAMAALLTGRLSDSWIRITRRWTLTAWCFLTIGLVLGALWSYGVLGWGGYWAWDPVENVAVLPWLMATAFLHSVMIQERRGMLKVWNLSLIVGTFALVTFGTFLTRGSILSSVHAFAESIVGPLYLGFLALVLFGGFGLIVSRSWRLRSQGRFDSSLSREAAFLGNNLLLLGLTLAVLIGTIFPLAVEALTGRRVSVGGPYFEQTTVPVFLVLLFMSGVGPLLSWRRTSGEKARRRLMVPASVGALTVAGLALAGVRNLAATAAFGLAAFVATANVAQLARGVRSYAKANHRPALRSVASVVARNRRLHGGLVVHVGVAIAVAGITASGSFGRQTEVTLSRGEGVSFAGYELTYQGQRRIQEAHRLVLVADVSVRRGEEEIGTAVPSLNLYPHASEPIGTPSIRYGVLRDLYTSVLGFEGDGSRATFRIFLNPGVLWLWIGGSVMALGGAVAAWPGRRGTVPPGDTPLRARAMAGAQSGRT
jgi:cytochrome c-type biogenesis protein CcmF